MSDINFVTVDSKQIENDLISGFEETTGEVFYPGDERRQFLLNMLPVILAVYNKINDSARQNLLRYARGEILDAIGELRDTPRLAAQKAKVTLHFILSVARDVDTPIPVGTRGTPDGTLNFVTLQDAVVPAGLLSVDVVAEAAETGAKYNGFTPGQIKTMVDPIPYVSQMTNTDTSAGGADIEADDDGVNVWSGYRERIREAPAKVSTAGHVDGYIYWAKTASQDIADVSVTSPETGKVKITVLMAGGEIPTHPVLDAVLAACSDKKRRPLTDYVMAAAPGTVAYDITLTYYISTDRATDETNIKALITGNDGAVAQYTAWQCGKLGRAINPDYLKQLMLNAGAFRVDITAPVYTAVDDDQVASTGVVTVNYGGLI